jgi:hypothetical protein
MAETIDLFKYKALSAELESIRGTKKPIHDFIKKLYNITDKLYFGNTATPETEHSARYVFMLLTKAMTYDGSVRGVNYVIRDRIRQLADLLTKYSVLTADNVLETYKHYDEIINFRALTVEELLKIDKLIDKLGLNRVYVPLYMLNEIKFLNNEEEFAKIILLNNNPNSLLGQSIKSAPKNLINATGQAQDLVNLLNPILKEYNEHNSTSSTTV